MPRYRQFFSPYFTSDAFQNSDERKIEKAIEDGCKSLLCLITKVWKQPDAKKLSIEDIAKKIAKEDKELLDRLKD